MGASALGEGGQAGCPPGRGRRGARIDDAWPQGGKGRPALCLLSATMREHGGDAGGTGREPTSRCAAVGGAGCPALLACGSDEPLEPMRPRVWVWVAVEWRWGVVWRGGWGTVWTKVYMCAVRLEVACQRSASRRVCAATRTQVGIRGRVPRLEAFFDLLEQRAPCLPLSNVENVKKTTGHTTETRSHGTQVHMRRRRGPNVRLD
jgi:hypothetical protein